VKIDSSLPTDILDVISELKKIENGKFYFVGGMVRDSLLSAKLSDVDLATNLKPDEIIAHFERNTEYRLILVGCRFGTVGIAKINDSKNYSVRSVSGIVEVTTFRSDGEYFDNRHPDSVNFSADIKDDLSRRDFTMNAIAVSLDDVHEFIDPFYGISDINDRLIRTVGDAKKRFSEDGLRILRAYRFAAQLGFSLDEELRIAAKELLPSLLPKLAAERVTEEIRKTVLAENAEKSVEFMTEDGIADILFGQKISFTGLQEIKPKLPMRMAFLLKGVGDAEKVVAKLTFSNEEKDDIMFLVKADYAILDEIFFDDFSLAKHLNNFSEKKVRLLAEYFNREDLLLRLELFLGQNLAVYVNDLDITGSEIAEILEVPIGPKIGEIKKILLERVQRDQTLNDNSILRDMVEEIKE